MKALVTGAGSGLGKAFSEELDKLGYDIVLVGRNEDNLRKTADELHGKTEIILSDLTDISQCEDLFRKENDIDILINNAGVGIIGDFLETDLQSEVSLIKLNCIATHILTKLYLKEFVKRGHGMILNVSSSAAFTYGPFFSSYYGSKAYVERFTRSVAEEIKNKNIYIGVMCPGPLKTGFTEKSGGHGMSGIAPSSAAKYAVRKMFSHKKIIVPGVWVRLGIFFTRFLPESVKSRIGYNFQKKKKEL